MTADFSRRWGTTTRASTSPEASCRGRRSCFPASGSDRSGSILVGLVWCLALLSLVVIGVLHTARMELQVGKLHGDRIQAHYLALAGIEKAKALLYQDAQERSRSSRNHSGNLYSAPEEFREKTFGRGTFSVIRRGRDDEGGGILYGVSDEESRINLNTASSETLSRLNGMTPELLAAIVDWRDGDDTAGAGGAESEYYLSLQPPSLPRNGSFQTVRELLMVRGVSPVMLLGGDAHHNGLLDVEDDGRGPVFLTANAAEADLGWAAMLTVVSTVRNVNAAGENRVNVQNADEAALSNVRGLTADIARAIVSYRGQNQLQNLADLLDVTAGGSQTNRNSGRGGGQGGGGPKVISEEMLLDMADDVTVDSAQNQFGLVNINTAGLEVLAALPGLDRQLAQAIVSHRQSSGYFQNVAWLLKVPGIDAAIFKQLAPLVTARSETFRILSEGRVGSNGTRKRIETVIHIGLKEISILAYREDDL